MHQTSAPTQEQDFPYRVFSDHLLELWAPRGPRRRVAATTTGLAEIEVHDRFTEQIIDLHWQALAAYFILGDRDQFAEFSGLELDGHRLVSSPKQLNECLRWAED